METQNGDAMEHSGNDTATTSPDDERKLFIGGLSWETTEANLKEFFSKFGEVDNVNLKTDPNTGRSRGFAFVVFKSSESVEGVLSSGDLTIQNKKVEAKRAKARQGKVFVGGLPAEVSEDDIKAHFGTYGKIVLMEMPFDKVRNQRKGFCFITFESENSMKNLLQSPKQVVGGKEVDVKKATPRNDQMGGMGGGFMRGAPRGAPRGGMMRGGRGGPRGGGWGPSNNSWGAPQWNQGYGGGYDNYNYGGGDGYGGGAGGYGGYGYSGYDNSYGGGYGNGYEGYGQAAGGGRGAPRGAGRGGPRGGGRFQPY